MSNATKDPRTHVWLHGMAQSRVVSALCERVAVHGRTVVHGSRGSSTSILTGAMAVRTGRSILLVVAHPDEADDALDDLNLFHDAGLALSCRRLAAMEALPGETGINLDLLAQRLEVIKWLTQSREKAASEPSVLVAPIQSLMQAVPGPEAIDGFSMAVRSGQALALGELLSWLSDAGYERADTVEQPGQFAARGGIVDIFLPTGLASQTPKSAGESQTDGLVAAVRVDFWGDTVASISRIDLDTMGSAGRIEQIQLIGAAADQVLNDETAVSLWSLLRDDTLVVLHEVLELGEQGRGYFERLTDPRGVFPPQAVFKSLISRPHVEVNQYSGLSGDEAAVSLPVDALAGFDKDATQAVQELAALAAGEAPGQPRSVPGKKATHEVVVLCQKPAERDRLIELMGQHAPAATGHVAVQVEVGYLHRGFVWQSGEDGGAIYLVPHHELFHRYHVRRQTRRLSTGSSASAKATDAFFDVEVGDYVVHVDHGIGQFVGLRAMRRKGKTEDYLTLEFANKVHLHVPASQIDLVQKYVGGFAGKPPLSLLGGKRWAKQKQQVSESVKDLAAQMLRVQAARASQPGIRYPDDTVWQRKFEAEFPYDETEDQLAAIEAVKRDMGHTQPMDRLICGDVGFGKTEVAVRAAFKAVDHGKQVAVLVPTTVLAEQHERTFGERMADYPFRVASISRFKTAGEATKVLKELEHGEVDVIIGTHRLLSNDVKFADLGLVIIDEEQRFGVEHKQRLMQLRVTVDVLTLSATPIPRTLHMSMLGLRDISSLVTPPLDRRAIVTDVISYDGKRIKQAMNRELNRDGQIFFVHNRVHNIQSIADEVQKLVPKARVAIGHGQMSGHELEQVMLRFMRREIDVLVCTTIIESGIDIPTANTIFINGADRFGLADLHQLRGRVGRYKHRAYCYLLLPMDRQVTDTASRRLRAIEQYSMLGAGFKIAMRDLEIRGAGNLLGAQQSGHIAAVGYEMYCQLLEQAAKRLRQEAVLEPAKTHLELPIAGQLPKRYIGSDKYRMDAYRRLSRAATLEELRVVVKDLTDAYGEPPAQAQTLLDLAELRIAATLAGADAIKLDGPDVIFRTDHPAKLEPVLDGAPGRVSVIDNQTVYWRPPSNYLEPPTLLAVLRKVFCSVGSAV